jgi:hypothetical protein
VGACDALPAPGTWQQITPPGVAISDGLALDPYTNGTVWLGADPGNGGAGGLFKSTDCGATWAHVNNGTNGSTVDGAKIWSLVIDPISAGTIYVVGAYGPQGLWKSTNGGADWVQLFPSGSEFANVVQYNFVSNVTMDPHDHMHLVVGTHGNCAAPYDPVCQAESTDGGASWHIMKIPNPSGGWVERSGPVLINQTSWLYTTIFNGMFVTTNNGASWQNITVAGTTGAAGGEFTHRTFVPSPNGYYYLPSVSRGGLLRSKDALSWELLPASPQGAELCVTYGGGNLYMADFQGGDYHVAPESDLTKWTTIPAPFQVTGSKQGAIYLEYDEAHHILYSSNFTGGLWRLVVSAS